jgi:hypothetical protein
MKRLILASLFMIVTVVVVLPMSAQDYAGCLECETNTRFGVLPDDWCRQVGHNETGQIYCLELDGGIQTTCTAYGGSCLNTDVCSDGNCGPWGGGGGGQDDCTIAPGGYCPVMCTSCTVLY